jgi:hypothetical protein
MMNRLLASVLLALALLGPAQMAPVHQAAQAATPPPAGSPANLRWDLVPKWIKWAAEKASISWPPNDGCAAGPVSETPAAVGTIETVSYEVGGGSGPYPQCRRP